MKMRLIVAAAFLAMAAGASAQAPTTVIVVRHAEKMAEPAADPMLTMAGANRVQALAAMLRDAGVSAVITTQYKRTMMTGAALGIPGEVVDARAPGHAKLVADSVLQKHRGRTVLVVGHSNTVPDIVAALGAPKPAPICDEGYDNMFVVTVPVVGAATVTHLHFGLQTACP